MKCVAECNDVQKENAVKMCLLMIIQCADQFVRICDAAEQNEHHLFINDCEKTRIRYLISDERSFICI